ncbi:Rpp14 family [Rasamsonia emersonii CBS 393.64]|uniref:Ribonuclease P/MRP protein subunit POP5 n=1 Tax=Rasamsonia emersonii (strain ATCC 16479 / CBS 393.64 / IMI 116815) TaxID=1408163 RepID=A0A0F4Z2F6_RASE3|nr:Rpp14 family [Rasamsonia emersonii CBS 393.64]KKA24068.1 Rpp14 family [Rasamsonia emersonii CBS 393.64]
MVRIKHRYLLIDILYPELSIPSSTKITSPSLKTHLQFHAPTPDALTPGLLAKMVREEVAEMFGDWGVGRLGVKYLSPATSTAIIRCPRASFRLVWAALTYMSHVPGPGPSSGKRSSSSSSGPHQRLPCVFRVVRVSGTMRKAEEEAIRRARREILRAKKEQETGVLDGLVGSTGSSSTNTATGAAHRKQPDNDPIAFAMDVDDEDDELQDLDDDD